MPGHAIPAMRFRPCELRHASRVAEAQVATWGRSGRAIVHRQGDGSCVRPATRRPRHHRGAQWVPPLLAVSGAPEIARRLARSSGAPRVAARSPGCPSAAAGHALPRCVPRVLWGRDQLRTPARSRKGTCTRIEHHAAVRGSTPASSCGLRAPPGHASRLASLSARLSAAEPLDCAEAGSSRLELRAHRSAPAACAAGPTLPSLTAGRAVRWAGGGEQLHNENTGTEDTETS